MDCKRAKEMEAWSQKRGLLQGSWQRWVWIEQGGAAERRGGPHLTDNAREADTRATENWPPPVQGTVQEECPQRRHSTLPIYTLLSKDRSACCKREGAPSGGGGSSDEGMDSERLRELASFWKGLPGPLQRPCCPPCISLSLTLTDMYTHRDMCTHRHRHSGTQTHRHIHTLTYTQIHTHTEFNKICSFQK